MAISESRREFLKNIALGGLAMGVPAMAGGPVKAAGASKSVLHVKPLGYQWETIRPG